MKNSKSDLLNHYRKQHPHLNIEPAFLKLEELPLTPKYSNWEDYIANPGKVVPKLSFCFEMNKGGRPAVIIEE